MCLTHWQTNWPPLPTSVDRNTVVTMSDCQPAGGSGGRRELYPPLEADLCLTLLLHHWFYLHVSVIQESLHVIHLKTTSYFQWVSSFLLSLIPTLIVIYWWSNDLSLITWDDNCNTFTWCGCNVKTGFKKKLVGHRLPRSLPNAIKRALINCTTYFKEDYLEAMKSDAVWRTVTDAAATRFVSEVNILYLNTSLRKWAVRSAGTVYVTNQTCSGKLKVVRSNDRVTWGTMDTGPLIEVSRWPPVTQIHGNHMSDGNQTKVWWEVITFQMKWINKDKLKSRQWNK